MEEEGAGGRPIRRRLEVGQGSGLILLGIPVSGPPLKENVPERPPGRHCHSPTLKDALSELLGGGWLGRGSRTVFIGRACLLERLETGQRKESMSVLAA